MQGGELRSSLPDARPTANRLVMPPDLSGRRAEVEGGEERPEIFPSERRQGGGCCGFPNAKSEEGPSICRTAFDVPGPGRRLIAREREVKSDQTFDFCLSTSIPVLTTSTCVVAWPQGDQFLGGGM